MTNAIILSQYERQLKDVEAQIAKLQRTIPTPEVIAEAFELAELRDNINVSIQDLRGAIAMGADCPEYSWHPETAIV